jgi:hypothetical protein
MAKKTASTSRKLPAPRELLAALKLARGFIRHELIEHAVVNYPDTPQETLGRRLDSVLRRYRPVAS